MLCVCPLSLFLDDSIGYSRQDNDTTRRTDVELFDDTPITWLENTHTDAQAAKAAVDHLLPDGITLSLIHI